MPFVLVHGALLWKLAIVAMVGLVFGAVWVFRRLAARRWARAVVHCLDIATHARVIRGELGGGSASTTEDVHHRDRRVWIQTPGDRYELVGEICVLAGSTARGLRTTVKPGDPVIAHGTITRAPGGAADYRTDSTAFALAAEPDAPILLAARRPIVGLTPLSRAVKLWITGATTVIAFGALCALGTHWHDRCVLAKSDVLANTHACVLASATPGGDDATLLYAATWKRDRLTVARYLGDCAHLLDALEASAVWDELAVTAAGCDARAIQQRALAELGRFGEAAALGHTHNGPPLGKLMIWAKRWNDAAALAERHAHEVQGREEVSHWYCLGRLLRSYGGADVSPDEFSRDADCPAIRDEMRGRPMMLPVEQTSWGPVHTCEPHDLDDPVDLVRTAESCALYSDALRDRRVEVALSLWSE